MILVTGASGFLGRHLVRYLSGQNLEIRALYKSRPPDAELKTLPGTEWMCCDLLDVFAIEDAVKGVSEIYHCAAIVSFAPAMREEMLHFNPESTANLVNEALQQGIRKMVYVSSVSALGRSGVENKDITEEEEWGESGYNSAYAISKYLAETEVWRGIGEGLNAVIVNPGIILGACTPEDPPGQLMHLAWNEFPFYSKGVTSWVGIDDVIQVLVQLMNSDTASERFICGENHAYKDILTSIAQSLNKKPPHIAAGSFLTGLAWRWNSLKTIFGFKGRLTREMAGNANIRSFYNNKKLTGALPGFSYTPIAESVKRMAASFIVLPKN